MKRASKGKGKASGPSVIVALECRDGDYRETVRLDDIRPAAGETDAERKARETRAGWTAKAVAGWKTLSPGSSIEAVYGDGARVACTFGEAGTLVAVARDEAPAASGPTMPPPRACDACGQPTHKGYQWCEACAALAAEADASEASKAVPSISEARRMTRKAKAAKVAAVTAIATVAKPAIDVSPDDVIAPGEVPHFPGHGLVFTIGYDGGLTAERFAAHIAELGIGRVIDTRIGNTARAHGWSEKALRTALGSRYVLAQGRGAVADAIAAAGRMNVLLLRKEEAPGDSAYALELAAMIPSTIHVWRNEYVAGHALQAAIDADRASGGDHAYPCIADDGTDAAQSAERASA